MKIYEVSYGDGGCSHVLERFSTRPKAEAYLAYFKGVDEPSWFGYLPEIDEIEVDGCNRPYLIRDMQIDKDGKIEPTYHNSVDITTKRSYDKLLFEPEAKMGRHELIYKTTTLNKEDAELEALASWMVVIIEDRWVLDKFDVNATDDWENNDQWIADCFDI